MTSLALWYGETHPGSRILIISLTLKSTRENYWNGAPGGIFRQNHDYGLNLRFNHTDSVWYHENGSRGRLAGAETRADIEYLRGAAAEADICIIDECKSFAPDLLTELIRDVIEPGLMTRDGFLVMGGTPGCIPQGPFYDATAEQARTSDGDDGLPTCIPVGMDDAPAYARIPEEDKPDVWRLHTWTIEDNTGAPNQWRRALKILKKEFKNDPNHPTWRREYLGEWVVDALDLVYSWSVARASKKDVVWAPLLTDENITGLPEELGPWHLVLGIDIGWNDPSAFVLAAYSEKVKELRHIYDFKQSEMLVEDFTIEILEVIERYGLPEAIVADTASGGAKILIETINQRYGLGIIPAEKPQKQAWQQLLNADFLAERVKIIPGTDLAHELAGHQWDLSRSSKLILARTGALKEDPRTPNHLCDALLYLYRYAHHFFSEAPADPVERNSPAWWREKARKELEDARARKKAGVGDPLGLKQIAKQRPQGREAWN